MTFEEAYRHLGSIPCECCDDCRVNEQLEYLGEECFGNKPRHCRNAGEMILECREKYMCPEAKEWEEQYDRLMSE